MSSTSVVTDVRVRFLLSLAIAGSTYCALTFLPIGWSPVLTHNIWLIVTIVGIVGLIIAWHPALALFAALAVAIVAIFYDRDVFSWVLGSPVNAYPGITAVAAILVLLALSLLEQSDERMPTRPAPVEGK